MKLKGFNIFSSITFLGLFIMPIQSSAANTTSDSQTVNQILEQANHNNNWTVAFLTDKHAQVVIINASLKMDIKNELSNKGSIFDQNDYISAGNVKTVLRESVVKPDEMLFIPQELQYTVKI